MFELMWNTFPKDGKHGCVHYLNLNGDLVQDTILMDVNLCQDLNPATIKIRGMDKPAVVKSVNADGEEVILG